MSVSHWLATAEDIIGTYSGRPPLHLFLKAYFRRHRNMGATDRRTVAGLLYPYYRLGKALAELPTGQRLAVSNFLCRERPDALLAEILEPLPGLPAGAAGHPLPEKIRMVQTLFPAFDDLDLFPFTAPLSGRLDRATLARSMLQQPLTWIRIRRGHEQAVRQAIDQAGIAVERSAEDGRCLGFRQGQAMHVLPPFRAGLFEIQDLNSQRTMASIDARAGEYWWDCCAGGGGKSLMVADRAPGVDLLLTDVREKSLANARERMEKAGCARYAMHHLDLLDPQAALPEGPFDGIILDAPCSGSGTWSRTPEAVTFFDAELVDAFAVRQKEMLGRVAGQLGPGGRLAYITCSVFRAENEEVVAHARSLGLNGDGHLLAGTYERADTLYVASLQAPR